MRVTKRELDAAFGRLVIAWRDAGITEVDGGVRLTADNLSLRHGCLSDRAPYRLLYRHPRTGAQISVMPTTYGHLGFRAAEALAALNMLRAGIDMGHRGAVESGKVA